MTLLELQNILGQRINLAMNDDMTPAEKAEANEQSEIIARLAKQMINNADIVLRTNKLQDEGKLKGSAIVEMVGNGNIECRYDWEAASNGNVE